MEYLIYITIIVICLLLEGFFSGSEIAVVSVDRLHLKHMIKKRVKGATLLRDLKKKPEWFLTTTLVGTNLSTVTGNTIATYLVMKYFGAQYDYLTIAFMTPLILIFGEIVPKTIYQQRANEIAPRISPLLKITMTILSPLVFLSTRVSGFFSYILGREEKERDLFVTKDEIELLLKMSDSKTGGMKITQKKMIHRIFDFTETSVKEAMIPAINVKALDINDPVEDAILKLKQWKHSRVPVYRERFDNIVGVIHAYDLIIPKKNEDLQAYMRPIRYYPEYTPIDDIMLKLQQEGEGMAAVVDEYGGVAGIVTIEDIIEEVVGEIDDEYDNTQKGYTKISDNEYIVKGHLDLDVLRDELRISLPEGNYETIAGFILDSLKKIPKKGEICKYRNITMKITKCSSRAIKEIRILVDKNDK